MDIIFDEEKAFDVFCELIKSAQKMPSETSICVGALSIDGHEFELQLKATNEEDDFIDDNRFHCVTID